MVEMAEKKEWIKPEILIIVHGTPNESVLFRCSSFGCSEGGPDDPTEGQGS